MEVINGVVRVSSHHCMYKSESSENRSTTLEADIRSEISAKALAHSTFPMPKCRQCQRSNANQAAGREGSWGMSKKIGLLVQGESPAWKHVAFQRNVGFFQGPRKDNLYVLPNRDDISRVGLNWLRVGVSRSCYRIYSGQLPFEAMPSRPCKKELPFCTGLHELTGFRSEPCATHPQWWICKSPGGRHGPCASLAALLWVACANGCCQNSSTSSAGKAAEFWLHWMPLYQSQS